MMIQYDHMLLQMLMVLFPIILYQALMSDKRMDKNIETAYWFAVCAIAICLCVIFSIKIENGIYLDLRMIPWFLAFIYGGPAVGILVSALFIVIRFLTGGAGMIPAFIIMFVCCLIIFQFRSLFKNWNRSKKIRMSVFFLLIISYSIPYIGSLMLDVPVTKTRLVIYGVYIVSNAITVWLAVYLLESHREKMELLNEIRKNEKLHVVGQMAASVAHEIRNPMTSVRGFVQLLSTSPTITDSEKTYLSVCLMELDRANKIISDYLSLGKSFDQEKLRSVNLTWIASQSVKSLSSYALMESVEVVDDFDDHVVVLGIPGRVQQMFVNLIKNAIEAASPSGQVQVFLRKREDYAEVMISDNGIGMTSQQIENLGLPYYSTKEKGTGLGIMVTLQIIKEMNGTWTVQSQLNQGTQFTLTFPLVEQIGHGVHGDQGRDQGDGSYGSVEQVEGPRASVKDKEHDLVSTQ
ncbi:ATP-binding protein [Neobacillus dielmonensis]|uniref:ATP-binding protein n=1 Tax=Neobacillus dielmonensis TaxID=1347369 RepID=UPI0005A6F0BD|nr:sensor histidine kinase [Neobacillus dielmonensis]